ncbi:MAG: MBL fold metallo-hydrolase [Alcanivoracaceae bacterium]|nr:MBL fold metallo-hydrolase [Alcanivoracaceae bacterium]
MTVTVHHLNCGSLCPVCQRLVNGEGSLLRRGELVCHCLLVETPSSLVLVDTGLGTADMRQPVKRLGKGFASAMAPKLDLADTAIEQVKALGFEPADVRHLIPTHLDADHAGGVSDFPGASVHVRQQELDQVLTPNLRERMRFRQSQFAHGPKWQVEETTTEQWFGFDAIRPIDDIDLLMVPLPGHSRGHVGVAVNTDDGWLLHCGDAYFHRSEVSGKGAMPAGLKWFERSIQAQPRQREATRQRLAALHRDHGDQVSLFCAHDPVELARFR